MESNNNKFIAISGNIGVGKTNLAKILEKELGYKAFLEEVENNDNPFLEDFYNDKKSFALKSQIYFLADKIDKMYKIKKELNHKPVVLDRSIYEDAFVFASNLYEEGNMTAEEYKLYMNTFEIVKGRIVEPDLMIYLKADVETLKRRIENRGREFEKELVSSVYLENLNKKYDEWIVNYDNELFIIDTNNLDFVNNKDDMYKIIEMIEGEVLYV